MKAKRVLAVTMAAMMIMSLTACGNSGNSGGKEKTKIGRKRQKTTNQAHQKVLEMWKI